MASESLEKIHPVKPYQSPDAAQAGKAILTELARDDMPWWKEAGLILFCHGMIKGKGLFEVKLQYIYGAYSAGVVIEIQVLAGKSQKPRWSLRLNPYNEEDQRLMTMLSRQASVYIRFEGDGWYHLAKVAQSPIVKKSLENCLAAAAEQRPYIRRLDWPAALAAYEKDDMWS